jgi:hypothetical protein
MMKWDCFFVFILIAGAVLSCNNITKNNVGNDNVVADTLLTYKIVKSDESQCAEWKEPKKSEILSLLNSLQEVTSREWNDCYGDWTCGIEGELMYKKKKCYYRLDAGGWIILNDGNKQQYFVCKKGENCWSIFPSESFCDDAGKIIDSP